MKSLLLVTSLLCAASVAQGATTVYFADLTGAAEAPPTASAGIGAAYVTIDDVASTMRVQVTFSGLTGTVTAAHIHAATAVALTGTAGVATGLSSFPSGVTAGSYDTTFDMTLAGSYNGTYFSANGGTPATAFTALQAALAANKSYLNVHSSSFGGGEIRGFLAVPEPSSTSMFGLLGLGLALKRRRR